MLPEDALKYGAAKLKSTADWALDVIGGELCDTGHDDEIDVLHTQINDVAALVTKYCDRPHVYSNGRVVKSRTEIETGVYVEQVWSPDPDAEPRYRWNGELTHDPGTPRRGSYIVDVDPIAQTLTVVVLREGVA